MNATQASIICALRRSAAGPAPVKAARCGASWMPNTNGISSTWHAPSQPSSAGKASRTGRRTCAARAWTCASAARIDGTRKKRSDSIANQRSLGVVGFTARFARAGDALDHLVDRAVDQLVEAPAETIGIEIAAMRIARRHQPQLVDIRADHHRDPGRRARGQRVDRRLLDDGTVDARDEHHATAAPGLQCDLRAEDRVARHVAEGAHVCDADLLRDLFGQAAGAVECDGGGHAALHDHAAEQTRRGPRCTEQRHQRAARRLPEERDVPGVATEGADLVAYPLERGDEIEHAPVAARAVVGEFRVREKAERAEAVVDGDDHDIAVARRAPGRARACARPNLVGSRRRGSTP